jgi:hypothetical protein
MAVRRDKVEQRLARIERLAGDTLDQVAQLREELGRGESAAEMWARMLYQVLSEVDSRGGSVKREELLEIGQSVGYERQGMAGHYQKLLRLEEGVAHLTSDGRARLKALEARFGPKTKATTTA